ncbi:interferon-induced gtp-binding protein mx2 [Ophiostoma piceae UAMH 11346]|uniref:Interferon-induced gtp-binding protein mx2 n=1 Tax=Ophiostoma piceae (strain UAMH 11346) TaxID=1262450 RepID=S3CN12_OPHP1|nr:interferon-induced gtp-binding protein mx2 [Ophiostoma piceae UAMH 11346]
MVNAEYIEDGQNYYNKTVEYVSVDQLENRTADMDNGEHVCKVALDIVESYHEVSRKRFIDTFSQHVWTADQLSDIAGEDAITCNRRQVLGHQLESLEEAIKVLVAR